MPLLMRDARVWLRRSALIGVAAVIALGLATVLFRFGDIETDLEKRSREALEAKGISEIEVVFDGRDGTLYGIVASEADAAAALEVVEGVSGVRAVRSELTTIGGAAPADRSATTTADRSAMTDSGRTGGG
jgi:hypothetical protein